MVLNWMNTESESSTKFYNRSHLVGWKSRQSRNRAFQRLFWSRHFDDNKSSRQQTGQRNVRVTIYTAFARSHFVREIHKAVLVDALKKKVLDIAKNQEYTLETIFMIVRSVILLGSYRWKQKYAACRCDKLTDLDIDTKVREKSHHFLLVRVHFQPCTEWSIHNYTCNAM